MDPVPSNSSDGTAEPRQKRILIVEDDRVVQRTVGQLLADQGYLVMVANEGSDALTQAQAGAPDLILLDLGLPSSDPFAGGNFDGFAVMRWLQRRADERPIPVVVLTARQDPAARRQAMELGAAAFMTKPFKTDELVATIRAVLGDG